MFALHEMQTASSRIWTRVTVSISYYSNHHTTSASYKCEGLSTAADIEEGLFEN